MPAMLRYALFTLCLLFATVPVAGARAAPPDPQAIGGIQGEAGTAGDSAGSAERAVQVVPLLRPLPGPDKPVGHIRLWMENFPDMRVPAGTLGRLNASATQPGYLMLWTADATGAMFAIADGVAPGRAVVAVGPDRPTTLPSDLGFEIAVCPPVGPAVWFAIHSDKPIPETARQRLAQEMPAARIGEEGGAARFRAVLDQVVAATPGWAAESHVLRYEVLPGPADPRCKSADTSSLPAPAPSPKPAGPALSWLVPTATPVAVHLYRAAGTAMTETTSFRARDEVMIIEVRPPVSCPGLTVLAAGAGGAIDELLPHAGASAATPAAGETVRVPRAGSGVQLRVRVPPEPGALERVIALCDTRAGAPLLQRRDGDPPTVTLLPQDPGFVALTRDIEAARRGGGLLVGVASYSNLGAR